MTDPGEPDRSPGPVRAPRSRPVQTYLFVPAHEERKVLKAVGAGSDAVILDLEASVPDDKKAAGRETINQGVRSWRTADGPEIWVRVNVAGPHFAADAAEIDWSGVDGAVVAKAEDPDALNTLVTAGARRLLPLIESAAGFGALDRLAGVPTVERFAIGTWDLMLDLGLLTVPDPDESELIWQLRGDLVLASRRLGLQPPVDGVYARLEDEGALRALCERALRLGYGAKLLIHPRQIPVARSVFGPNDEDVRFAREVVEAYDRGVAAGRGAIQVQGRMIDLPMVERARALLARWPSALTLVLCAWVLGAWCVLGS